LQVVQLPLQVEQGDWSLCFSPEGLGFVTYEGPDDDEPIYEEWTANLFRYSVYRSGDTTEIRSLDGGAWSQEAFLAAHEELEIFVRAPGSEALTVQVFWFVHAAPWQRGWLSLPELGKAMRLERTTNRSNQVSQGLYDHLRTWQRLAKAVGFDGAFRGSAPLVGASDTDHARAAVTPGATPAGLLVALLNCGHGLRLSNNKRRRTSVGAQNLLRAFLERFPLRGIVPFCLDLSVVIFVDGSLSGERACALHIGANDLVDASNLDACISSSSRVLEVEGFDVDWLKSLGGRSLLDVLQAWRGLTRPANVA
jgi:hypothetical protein